MPIHEVKVPQLGVNDDYATITDLLVHNYHTVTIGQHIATLETTKAVFELTAEQNGFIRWIPVDDEVKTSQVIAVIATTTDELSEYVMPMEMEPIRQITKKAQALADELGINIDDIETDAKIITTKEVQKHKNKQTCRVVNLPDKINLAIYGAGDAAAEIYWSDPNPYANSTVFIDDYKKGEAPNKTSILTESQFLDLEFRYKPSLFIAIADGKRRVALIAKFLSMKFDVINIDFRNSEQPYKLPRVGRGIHIKAGCVIGNNASISNGCILDYNTTVSHDSILGQGVHLAPGATLGSSVKIGNYTIVGINASVATGITIGENCIITPGTSITQDVPDNSIVEGVPGKIIGTRK